MKNKKTLKLASYSVGVSLIVLAVVIVINLLVSQLPISILKPDFTTDKLSTLSEESLSIINEVDKDITMYYIVEPNAEQSTIEGILARYDDASSKIKVVKIDPTSQPNFTSKYTSSTVSSNSVIVASDIRSKVVDGSSFIKYTEATYFPDQYLTYDEYYQYQQYYGSYYQFSWESVFFGENELTSAIDYVIREEIPIMYTLDGHGETSLDGNAFLDLISKENIEVKTLSLATGDEIAVPDDAAMLMINTPTEDLTAEEANAIIDYLDNGGKVILFTRYDVVSPDLVPNLLTVCDHMGLEPVSEIIADASTSNYQQYQYVLVPNVTGNGFSELLDAKNIYVFMQGSHGIQTSGSTDDAEIYNVLQTSSSGYIYNEDTYLDPDSAEKSTYNVAVQSIIPETKGNLIWFASPAFITSNYASSGNGTLFSTLLQSLGEKSTSVALAGKPITSSTLTVTASNLGTWSIIFTVVCVGILSSGIIVWAVRRRK